ncbi:GerAB/ArcD/ProY family transporter [Bacillus sp. FJAT-27225]|uniref:GerAB/ArcD/ProY family transporter n=1 Tax=Bacillus sp. FJAT-27225 TaxID=1743144 RepID=UPI0020C7A493|nr:GerAB/ArcD/ProY family transporter [Bacillus sp. FJAT-27225]
MKIPEKYQVSTFFTFFLVHTMQFGIGVLGFQRIIAVEAGYDAWISVIVAGLLIHPILWMAFKMMSIAEGDIVSIHQYAFGNTVGKLLTIPFIVYCILTSITTLRTFIEVVQVWMFQDLSTFWFGLAFLLLTVYIIYGGFRTVTGIVFFSVILPSYILVMFLYTIPFSDFTNLLPILDHSVKDLAKASTKMSLTYIGWELILVYLPFIKNGQQSQKFAHWGLLLTTFIYTYITIISFAFFSQGQLERTVWATLSMFKIVEMPFVERFEYVGIATWGLIILPNICLGIWAATRCLKRAFQVRQKNGVIGVSLVCLIVSVLLTGRGKVDMINTVTGQVGLWFNFAYLPLLFLAVLVARKVKKRAKT